MLCCRNMDEAICGLGFRVFVQSDGECWNVTHVLRTARSLTSSAFFFCFS